MLIYTSSFVLSFMVYFFSGRRHCNPYYYSSRELFDLTTAKWDDGLGSYDGGSSRELFDLTTTAADLDDGLGSYDGYCLIDKSLGDLVHVSREVPASLHRIS